MALNTLKIIVTDGGKFSRSEGSEGGAKNRSGKNIKETRTWKLTHPQEVFQEKVKKQLELSPRMSYAIGVSSGLTKQVLSSALNYYINDIGRKTGDSNYQAQVNRQMEVAKDFVINPITSALGGTAAGAMFGPIGAVIGGVAGITSSLISTGYKYAERQRAYAHEIFRENNNQAYNLARANYSAMTGRVR